MRRIVILAGAVYFKPQLMNYSEKLKDPRWQSKRFEILERDGFMCTNCKSEIHLHVHHLGYIFNKDPWQYENDMLITLCKDCHTNLTEIKNEVISMVNYNFYDLKRLELIRDILSSCVEFNSNQMESLLNQLKS